ncbi:ABC transporter ATP-binding protein [Leuconostoc lactis]|uniref:ATP-binding cassette domain-containing protein n=1 Tax=Leuconostoc lactis TaxID=1246 RepID=A0A6L7AF94_LEULA|nr:ABC transporter ATP-binding protein [Leuconostoc lactis]MCT8386980.1 ABC transporter ATP-binding protein [Leuconostoc lactis]MWN21081.1 ATP-binding cassette domain-containing protein [Leuconostoc lactis]
MTTILALQNMTKSYGTRTVLDQVSLQLPTGQLLGLIGPSGSGKSTVIKLALGMTQADTGEAYIFETRMPNRKALAQIGYMAQNDALYETLTGYDNLKFFAQMRDIKAVDHEISRVAQIVDLTAALKQQVKGYSGGMKRRLSLAIALLGEPGLLILDEPTVGIDPALRLQIWEELRRQQANKKTILMTTHVMDEAERVDRVVLLFDGRIIADDSPAALKAQYDVSTVEQVFLKAEVEATR